MKHRKFISSALAAIMLFGVVAPIKSHAILESDIAIQEKTGQPFSSYWYPKELLNWSPKTDKDAKFNRGTVELQKRIDGDELKKSQSDDAKVISLAIANKSTGSTPSQGKDEFEGYNFSYWQYIDTLVSWGGSAGEGLIVPPSADLIDAAHTNGVPVLGTIFFPPEAYGGKFDWMYEFLTKDANGNFPMAHKLVEVAEYYNFDGWFINQETGERTSQYLNKELADLMKEFMAYLQKIKPKSMEVIWYDSMIDDGRVFWQNRLNEYNQSFLGEKGKELSDGMFLNFWWTNSKYSTVDPEDPDKRIPYTVTGKELKESGKLAEKMGRSKYDLYAGVDVQANGYNTEIKWDYLFPKDKEANASLGLYCPSWTYDSSSTVEEFLEKEEKFWVNESGDPRKDSNDHWKGISNNIVEKSPVTELPFVTNFSMGNGEFFNVNGKQVSSDEWNHRGMMDILPTYRWVVDNNKNKLDADIDYTESYYGGNSIGIKGSLVQGGETKVKLYASDLDLANNTDISIKYKENSANTDIKLELNFYDKGKQIINLDTEKNGDWTEAKASLAKYKKDEIEEISLIIKSNENRNDYKLNLGELSITDGKKGNKLSKIKNVKVEDFKVIDNYYGNARLTWDEAGKDVGHYEIYIEDKDGNRELVGATPSNAFYVKDIERELTLDSKTTFVINPVSKTNTSSDKYESKITVEWPALETPKANFEISSPIIAPGESITLTDKSLAGQSVKWIIEGLNKREEIQGNEAVVKFDKPGVYSLTQIVTNPAGETVNKKEDFIVVSKQAENGLNNLALNKDTKANASVNEDEGPKYAFDGTLSKKWCASGEKGNWIEVDLGKEMTIKELRMSHAQAGGESSSMNTSEYSVEVSNDGENWRKIKDVKGNTNAVSRDDLNYELARYVKVNINKSEQGSGGATRIYEIEVLGLDTDKIVVIDNKESLYQLNDTIKNIEEKYNNLGTQNKEFEAILKQVKEILDIVEVEKDEIVKAQDYLKEEFEKLTNL
ncbi:MAG: endo-beta-N-acetylglucosaminidase [Romboutsia sp.]|uniref:endo-beta-N-acetylglucosaminidase n=1 Tax=Romboutsia sp. TaxID=1965302 RepID=UPI003F321121